MANLNSKIEEFFFVSDSRTFSALDGLRGFAVFLVFLVHSVPVTNLFWGTHTDPAYLKFEYYFRQALSYAPFIGAAGSHTGVDLFFIISGFLIYYVINRKNLGIISFLVNRYKRLLPANTVLLLVGFTVYPPLTVLLNFLMLQFFFPRVVSINFVTWSLTYEICFYLFCAIWLTSAKKIPQLKNTKLFIVFSLAVWIIQWFIPESFFGGAFILPEISRFFAFFFGVMLAKLYFESPGVWKKLEPSLPILGVIALVFISWWRMKWGEDYNPTILKDRIIYYLMIDIAYVTIVASALTERTHFIKSFFSNKYLRILGVISYSFYLNHSFIGISVGARFAEAFKMQNITAVIIFLIAGFIFSFAIGTFMFHFLEKPYFKRKPEGEIKDLNVLEYNAKRSLP